MTNTTVNINNIESIKGFVTAANKLNCDVTVYSGGYGKPVSHVAESDSQVSNYSYDFCVDNTETMENLKEKVQRF